MIYKDSELPFLDALFAGFDHENGIIDRTTVQVYADFLEEEGAPEAEVVRAIGQLDSDHSDHLQLKLAHKLNHRQLFEVIYPENACYHAAAEGATGIKICNCGYPTSTIVNGWKTDTIAYFPPIKEDVRMVCFVTKTLTGPTYNKVVSGGTWTESFRLENAQGVQKTHAVYGEKIEFDPKEAYCPTVPGFVKKAMIIGYLNHVRKDAERRCGFGPPKMKKLKANKV